jgi:hypothetical protein
MDDVMEELDAALDELVDEDDSVIGQVQHVTDVERQLRHKILPQNAWRLISFFELSMSCPKDELHQW